jgi:hypothetical protein
MSERTFRACLSAVLAVAVAAAAAIVAGASDDSATPPRQAAGPSSRALLDPDYSQSAVMEVDSRQHAAFGVLARSRSTGDDVTAAIRSGLGKTGEVERNKYGFNIALARRAATSGHATWVVPGRGHVCKLDLDPAGAEFGFGVSCDTTENAENGYLLSTWVGGPGQARGEAAINGLVPDGVESVVVNLKDGARQRIPVIDNVYTLNSAVDPMSVELTGADGKLRRLPLDEPRFDPRQANTAGADRAP